MDSNEASAHVISTKTEAAEAVERARGLQIEQAVFDAMNKIFKEGDINDPRFMNVIHNQLPVLCVRVNAMDQNIERIAKNSEAAAKRNRQNMRWLRGTAVTVVLAIIGFAVAWGSLSNQVANNTKDIDKLQPDAIQATVHQATVDALKEVITSLQTKQP